MDTLNFPRHRRSSRPHTVETAGFTLSEVIVAIALTGVLVLAIISAGWTLIRVSRVSDEQAAVEAVLGRRSR